MAGKGRRRQERKRELAGKDVKVVISALTINVLNRH